MPRAQGCAGAARVDAAAPITHFSGNPSHPASLSPRNSPHCAAPSRLRVLTDQPSAVPHSPDLVRIVPCFAVASLRDSPAARAPFVRCAPSRCPAFFPATAARRSDEQGCSNAAKRRDAQERPPANWLILFMIPSNRSLMSMVGCSSLWVMPLLTGETETKTPGASLNIGSADGPEGVKRRDARNKVSVVG